MILASRGGFVPEFLRKPIATRDLPGGGGRVGYASLSRVMFYMPFNRSTIFQSCRDFLTGKMVK